MQEHIDTVSSIVKLVLKIFVTFFIGAIAYIFHDLEGTSKNNSAALVTHTTEIAVIKNSFNNLEKKVDEILSILKGKK